MGYRTASTRRSTAASAVSSQAVIVNTGNTAPAGSSPSFSAVGSTIAANTSISLGVTTVGQTSAATVTTVSAGPSITNIQYLDTNNAVIVGDVAVSTAGGNILINGTGFVANSNVYVNSTLVSNTFISSTQIRAILPAASSGNVSLMIFTPTNVGGIKTNGIRYSGVPSWTTSAVSFQNASAANVALVASSDSTLTYTLQAGSTLPTGISLNSAGYLAGTATGYSTNTSSTVVIIATDLEGQATQQTVNITVTILDPQFPYTTLLLNGETSVTPFISDASTNGFALTVAGDSKANKFSPHYGDGYYSNYLSSTSTGFTNASVTHGLAGNFTIEFWHYPTVTMTSGTYYYMAGASTGPLIAMNGGVVSFAHQGGFSVNGSAGVVQGQWNHIACVRSGTTVTVYLNGVSVGSGTDATNFSTAQTYGYGVANNGTSGTAGYISNFRITDGQALYTGTFTPSTAPLTTTSVGATGANVAASLTGTVTFLGFQSNRFIDKSSTNTALTLAGTPQVSPNIPFAASSTYSTYGSAYFDGTGDYLTAAANSNLSLGAGDFTIEAWVYTTLANQTYGSGIIGTYDGGSNGGWSLTINRSTGGPYGIVFIHANAIQQSYATYLSVNTWYHIAVTRSGTTLRTYLNGTQVATGTYSTTDAVSATCYIGSQGVGQYHTGYITDARLVKGTAVYTSTFTPPTAPLTAVANTQLLTLQYNGGANNSGIVDSGPINPVISKTGSVSQGTFSPYSQTGWSNYFPGSTSQVSFSSNAVFGYGTGDFTWEMWFNPSSSPNGLYLLDHGAGNAGALSFNGSRLVYYNATTGIGSSLYTTGFGNTFSIGTWYHIAAVRRSGTTYLYLNGTLTTSAADTNNYPTAACLIGQYGGGSLGFVGYISNVRLVKGVGVYTGNFTPSTTPLTTTQSAGTNISAITTGQTSILTCQSNRFADNSGNNLAAGLISTPSVQALSPFSPSAAYTPSLHGGSAYMSNAAANYLTVTDSNIWNTGATTPAFTVEAWIYPIGITGGCVVSGMYANSKVPFVIGIGNAVGVTATNNQIWFGYYSGGWVGSISTAQLTMNSWTHVAGVYTGTDRYLYVNGVKVATATATWPAFSAITTAGYIGKRWDGTGGGADGFNGYISDVRITKGSALYTAATITPPTTPLTNLTATPSSLLLNFDSGGIVDAHSSTVVETVGNAQVSTAVKKYGNSSVYFGGSQALLFPGSSIPGGAGSAFTVEFWINAPSVNSLTILRANGNASSLGLSTSASGQLIVSNTFAADFYTSTSTLSANVWTHVAIVRNSSNLYTIYFNGVSAGTAVTYATSIGTATQMYMAYNTYTGGYSTFYLDDFRVTNGFARYTANFTAPTSAFLGQ